MMRNYFIALVLLSVAHCLHASDAVRIVYRGEPIQVQLQVGHERRFVLVSQSSVKVGVPEFLRDKLSVTTIGSQVWLLARQNFDNEKIIFKTTDAKMVLEVSAAADYPPGENILLSTEANTVLSKTQVADQNCAIGMVTLVRYALQWAYAPRRLLRGNPCIRAVNYPKNMIDIMNCLRVNEAVCGGGVIARPIAAWRTADLYLSLLEVKNTLQTSVVLDPRAVAGDFKSAAFAHHRLAVANTGQSLTALVVVGDKPLSRSISKERWLDKTLAAHSVAAPY